jgi:hypothetical protein
MCNCWLGIIVQRSEILAQTNTASTLCMKAVRINGRAGGEEESCPPVDVSKVSLSLTAIWGLLTFCAIAKRK